MPVLGVSINFWLVGIIFIRSILLLLLFHLKRMKVNKPFVHVALRWWWFKSQCKSHSWIVGSAGCPLSVNKGKQCPEFYAYMHSKLCSRENVQSYLDFSKVTNTFTIKILFMKSMQKAVVTVKPTFIDLWKVKRPHVLIFSFYSYSF